MGKWISKLLGRKPSDEPAAPENREEPTIPVTDDLVDRANIAATISESLYPHLVVGCAQSVGLHRDHNEDAMLTLTANIASNDDNMLLGLFVVADGMGGHKHGELASEIAVRTMGSQVINKIFSPLLNQRPKPPEESLQEIMQDSVIEAHNTIIKEAPGGGTTLTALLIVGQRVIVVHIGDSRLYSLTTAGEIQALTRDHTLVMRMVELGQLSPQEAATHPQRNVLYRALGQGEPSDPDLTTFPLPGSGHFLLCSDGLWGLVPEDVITQIITTASDPQLACHQLIDAANAAGGTDNITAILVRLPD